MDMYSRLRATQGRRSLRRIALRHPPTAGASPLLSPAVDERLFATGVIRHDEGTTATELLEQLAAGPPAWMRDALCREPHPGVSWFPERGEDAGPAKAVCRRCLVLEECRAYAIGDHELRGIWGGLSDRQRRRLREGDPTLDLERVQPPRRLKAPVPAREPRPPAVHGERRMYVSGCRCQACRAGNAAAKAEYKRRARAKLRPAS